MRYDERKNETEFLVPANPSILPWYRPDYFRSMGFDAVRVFLVLDRPPSLETTEDDDHDDADMPSSSSSSSSSLPLPPLNPLSSSSSSALPSAGQEEEKAGTPEDDLGNENEGKKPEEEVASTSEVHEEQEPQQDQSASPPSPPLSSSSSSGAADPRTLTVPFRYIAMVLSDMNSFRVTVSDSLRKLLDRFRQLFFRQRLGAAAATSSLSSRMAPKDYTLLSKHGESQPEWLKNMYSATKENDGDDDDDAFGKGELETDDDVRATDENSDDHVPEWMKVSETRPLFRESSTSTSSSWQHLGYEGEEQEITDAENPLAEENALYRDLMMEHTKAVKVRVPGQFQELHDAVRDWNRIDMSFLRNGLEQVFAEVMDDDSDVSSTSPLSASASAASRHLIFPVQSSRMSVEGVVTKLGLSPVRLDNGGGDGGDKSQDSPLLLAVGTRPLRELVFLAKQVELTKPVMS